MSNLTRSVQVAIFTNTAEADKVLVHGIDAKDAYAGAERFKDNVFRNGWTKRCKGKDDEGGGEFYPASAIQRVVIASKTTDYKE